MAVFQKFLRRQFNVSHIGFAFRTPGICSRGHAQNADMRHIAFQQCIGRLRGTVGDEHDILRLNAGFPDQFGKNAYYSDRHAFFVCGGYLMLCQHLIGGIVQHNRVGEGTADIDSYSYFFCHSLSPPVTGYLSDLSAILDIFCAYRFGLPKAAGEGRTSSPLCFVCCSRITGI